MKKKIYNTVIGGIINKKGEILLLKRRKEPFVGIWVMPGGSIEFGESLEEALEREIREETNIDVKFVGVKGLVHEILHWDKTDKKLGHYLLWVCELKPLHFNIKSSREGPLKWFPMKDLEKHRESIAPSDFLMIKKFFIKKAAEIKVHKVKMYKIGKSYKIEETDL
jgi:mutator protein MutT